MIKYTTGRDVIFSVGDEFLGDTTVPQRGCFFFFFFSLFSQLFPHLASSSGLPEYLVFRLPCLSLLESRLLDIVEEAPVIPWQPDFTALLWRTSILPLLILETLFYHTIFSPSFSYHTGIYASDFCLK